MQLLWAVAHGLESRSKRMRAALGVTGPQRLVIRLIGRFGSAAPSDLAQTLHVHPSSLTGVLRRLEQRRLIRRVQDPRDGRRAILRLTPLGQKLNHRERGTVEAAVRQTLRGVTGAKASAAREVLGRLAVELGVDVS